MTTQPQPLIAVRDVEASSRWYRQLLNVESGHGGPEYERLMSDGELVLHAQRSRSQARNREHARTRLVELVRGALAERTPRRATAPTRGSRERTLAAKRRRSAHKQTRARIRPDED